ncbi:50S ribosomal protein L29 [Planctomycetota bacterium]|nr:50S ribosomal protein L29 [Planctomycetota bacterium]
MKKSEVHKMSDAEMTEEVARLRKQLFDLKCQSVTEKIENPRQLGNIKRDIARILTEQRQRQLQESK